MLLATKNITRGRFSNSSQEEIKKIVTTCIKRSYEFNNSAGFFYLSKKSLKAFYAFKKRINKAPGNGNKGWQEEQINNMISTRDNLRKELKEDINPSE